MIILLTKFKKYNLSKTVRLRVYSKKIQFSNNYIFMLINLKTISKTKIRYSTIKY